MISFIRRLRRIWRLGDPPRQKIRLPLLYPYEELPRCFWRDEPFHNKRRVDE